MTDRYDVLAIAAHPDDLEVVMGGTAAMLIDRGLRVLFVDLSPGEPPGSSESIGWCSTSKTGSSQIRRKRGSRLRD